MHLDQEMMKAELTALVNRAFSLPEVKCIRVRDTVICRGREKADRICEAVEKSWHDYLSDVDLCIEVQLHPDSGVTQEEYTAGIERFGFDRETCFGRSFIPQSSMWRLALKNGVRFDVGFSVEWSPEGEKLAAFPQVEEDEDGPVGELVWPMKRADAFWFVQVQALGKLFRNDYLIADHLAHMGLNETLEQQMVMRDIRYGTNHHRYGYAEKRGYEEYLEECPFLTGDKNRDAIARKLYAAAMAYEEYLNCFHTNWNNQSWYFFDLWECYERQGKAEVY